MKTEKKVVEMFKEALASLPDSYDLRWRTETAVKLVEMELERERVNEAPVTVPYTPISPNQPAPVWPWPNYPTTPSPYPSWPIYVTCRAGETNATQTQPTGAAA